MAFEEYFACEQLTNYLQKKGYDVTVGVGGLPTAFSATYSRAQMVL